MDSVSTALFLEAVKAGDSGRVKAMLGEQPHLAAVRSDDGLSAVLLAVYYGHGEIASLLAADPAALDIFEASALGHLDQVEALIKHQPVLVNAYGVDGFQPLGLACFFGHPPVVNYLIQAGAQVNSPSRNLQKVMPLHSAAAGRHLAIARLLIDAGADVDARQAHDYTPLHAAAQNGHAELVSLLVRHGVDLQARTTDGKTPYDLAVEAGHQAVADLLRMNL